MKIKSVAAITILTLGIWIYGCQANVSPPQPLSTPSSAPPTDIPADIDIPSTISFTLKQGDSKKLSNASVIVRFIEVVEDSRCPANVNCAEAGFASVKLEIMDLNKTEDYILSIGKHPQLEEQYAFLNATLLTLVSLDPQSVEGESIDPSDYEVGLQFTIMGP